MAHGVLRDIVVYVVERKGIAACLHITECKLLVAACFNNLPNIGFVHCSVNVR
ncbi:hypothetical protein SDC9_57053 [bioreactor metagenome]|uniref:Uncharacterized protein n=1 Tax=bioreactor metagenome TaxID=1076179 RepID=A0A644X3V9_9ZZZZ